MTGVVSAMLSRQESGVEVVLMSGYSPVALEPKWIRIYIYIYIQNHLYISMFMIFIPLSLTVRDHRTS